MEHLQTQLAAEFVHGFGQLGECGDLLVADSFGVGDTVFTGATSPMTM